MIADVGNIITELIEDLPFIDPKGFAGVVKVITMQDTSDNNRLKTFPVSCNMSEDECKKGKRYLDLVPDSSKRSVLYLEDTGLRFQGRDGTRPNYSNWKASYNLICWLNLPKLGVSGCSYSALAIAGIMEKFPLQPFNFEDSPLSVYNRVMITLLGQQPKSVNPMAKYSYKEEVNQFLMYPYDHFMLNIDVDFKIDNRCLILPAPLDPLNCITK